MKIYVDLETLDLIVGPGFRTPPSTLRFKRGDAASLEVVFLAGGATAVTIGDPSALQIEFGVKLRNRYDEDYLAHAVDWTMPGPEDPNPIYQSAPSFNTEELNLALGIGSPGELAELMLMGEITWRLGEGLPTSTRTFSVIVENDVNRGTEGVPTSGNPAYPPPVEIVTISTLGSHAVRFDQEQTLTAEQKAQARANMGVEAPQSVDATNVSAAIVGMSGQTLEDAKAALGSSSHRELTGWDPDIAASGGYRIGDMLTTLAPGSDGNCMFMCMVDGATADPFTMVEVNGIYGYQWFRTGDILDAFGLYSTLLNASINNPEKLTDIKSVLGAGSTSFKGPFVDGTDYKAGDIIASDSGETLWMAVRDVTYSVWPYGPPSMDTLGWNFVWTPVGGPREWYENSPACANDLVHYEGKVYVLTGAVLSPVEFSMGTLDNQLFPLTPTTVSPGHVAAAITSLVEPDLSSVKTALGIASGGGASDPSVANTYYVSLTATPGTGVKGNPNQPFSSINEAIAATTSVSMTVALTPTSSMDSFALSLDGVGSCDVYFRNAGVLIDSMSYRPVVTVTGCAASTTTLRNDGTLDLLLLYENQNGTATLIIDGFDKLALSIAGSTAPSLNMYVSHVGCVEGSSSSSPGMGNSLDMKLFACGYKAVPNGIYMPQLLVSYMGSQIFQTASISFYGCYGVNPIPNGGGATLRAYSSLLNGSSMDFTSFSVDGCSYLLI